jgi:hypothetical protein
LKVLLQHIDALMMHELVGGNQKTAFTKDGLENLHVVTSESSDTEAN